MYVLCRVVGRTIALSMSAKEEDLVRSLFGRKPVHVGYPRFEFAPTISAVIKKSKARRKLIDVATR